MTTSTPDSNRENEMNYIDKIHMGQTYTKADGKEYTSLSGTYWAIFNEQGQRVSQGGWDTKWIAQMECDRTNEG